MHTAMRNHMALAHHCMALHAHGHAQSLRSLHCLLHRSTSVALPHGLAQALVAIPVQQAGSGEAALVQQTCWAHHRPAGHITDLLGTP